ncbi:MAG: hypothetical protein WBZ04_03035, partial [Candidatus Nanopelagicales bacterium]
WGSASRRQLTALPPSVECLRPNVYLAAVSWPQVHGSQVQFTHVQFGLSHFLFSVSAISFSLLVTVCGDDSWTVLCSSLILAQVSTPHL